MRWVWNLVEPWYRDHYSKKGCKIKLFFHWIVRNQTGKRGRWRGVKRDGGWVGGLVGWWGDFEEGKAAVASVRLQCQD